MSTRTPESPPRPPTRQGRAIDALRAAPLWTKQLLSLLQCCGTVRYRPVPCITGTIAGDRERGRAEDGLDWLVEHDLAETTTDDAGLMFIRQTALGRAVLGER